MSAPPKPLVLIILDGWGYAPPSNSNAISLARKPNYDRLLAEFPNTLIYTSGRYVGLPTGQRGGRRRKHYLIDKDGELALGRAWRTITAMADGLEAQFAAL